MGSDQLRFGDGVDSDDGDYGFDGVDGVDGDDYGHRGALSFQMFDRHLLVGGAQP